MKTAILRTIKQTEGDLSDTNQLYLTGPPQVRDVSELFEHPQQIHNNDGRQRRLRRQNSTISDRAEDSGKLGLMQHGSVSSFD